MNTRSQLAEHLRDNRHAAALDLINQADLATLTSTNDKNQTLLHLALEAGAVDVAERLLARLENHPMIFVRDHENTSALLIACAKAQIGIQKKLIERADAKKLARLLRPNKNGDTALHQLASFGIPTIVALICAKLTLEDKLNSLNHADANGNTPLGCAILKRNHELTALFINHGSLLNLHNHQKKTAFQLFCALTAERQKIVFDLLTPENQTRIEQLRLQDASSSNQVSLYVASTAAASLDNKTNMERVDEERVALTDLIDATQHYLDELGGRTHSNVNRVLALLVVCTMLALCTISLMLALPLLLSIGKDTTNQDRITVIINLCSSAAGFVVGCVSAFGILQREPPLIGAKEWQWLTNDLKKIIANYRLDAPETGDWENYLSPINPANMQELEQWLEQLEKWQLPLVGNRLSCQFLPLASLQFILTSVINTLTKIRSNVNLANRPCSLFYSPPPTNTNASDGTYTEMTAYAPH